MYNLDGSKNVFIVRLSCKNDDRWQDVLHPFRHPILCHRIIKIYRSSDVNFYHPIFEKKQLTARQFHAALSLAFFCRTIQNGFLPLWKLIFVKELFVFLFFTISHMKPSFVTSYSLHTSLIPSSRASSDFELVRRMCSVLWKVHLIVCATIKAGSQISNETPLFRQSSWNFCNFCVFVARVYFWVTENAYKSSVSLEGQCNDGLEWVGSMTLYEFYVRIETKVIL